MATLIGPPAALRYASWSLSLRDTLTTQRSPYSLVETRLDWGGELWTLDAATPPMTEADAAEVAAYLDRLRDANRAMTARPLGTIRHGTTPAETLTVTADAAVASRALAVTGLTAGRTLGAGSLISIADRLHRVRLTVTAAANGAATLELAPRLRAAVANGATVQCNAGVRAQWRLVGRAPVARDLSVYGHVGPMTLQFEEALA